MARVLSNLYAICSLDPVTQGVGDVSLYCCLPLDMDSNGLPADGSRYVSLVMVPSQCTNYDLLDRFNSSRAYAASWLTYMWEV